MQAFPFTIEQYDDDYNDYVKSKVSDGLTIKHFQQMMDDAFYHRDIEKCYDIYNTYGVKVQIEPFNLVFMLKHIRENFKQIYDFNWIDTSNITNMSKLFDNCPESIPNVSTWDVSNVTDMSYMFRSCIKFKGDLSIWDVSNVKYFDWMFYGCRFFDFNCLRYWDLSSAIDFDYTFAGTGQEIPKNFSDKIKLFQEEGKEIKDKVIGNTDYKHFIKTLDELNVRFKDYYNSYFTEDQQYIFKIKRKFDLTYDGQIKFTDKEHNVIENLLRENRSIIDHISAFDRNISSKFSYLLSDLLIYMRNYNKEFEKHIKS